MKPISRLALALLILLAFRGAADAAKPVVAVFDLTRSGVEAGDARVITDLLRSRIVQWRNFDVVDRYAMDRKAEEIKFPMGDCGDSSCGLPLGRALNADKMVLGAVAELMGEYVVIGRLVDVKTGEVEQEESLNCGKRATTIRKAVNRLADDLMGKISVIVKVTGAEGRTFHLDAGGLSGLKRGMTLKMFRKVPVQKEGGPAGVVEEYVGELKIGRVYAATADAARKSGEILPGDYARLEFTRPPRIAERRMKPNTPVIPPTL